MDQLILTSRQDFVIINKKKKDNKKSEKKDEYLDFTKELKKKKR